MSSVQRRPIRIAGCSGAASDRRHAMLDFASNHDNDPVDVIIGDFLSEANMTARGASKYDQTAPTWIPESESRQDKAAVGAAYEPTFLESLEPALPHIAKHRIKVAVNAGASDTELLHQVVTRMIKARDLDLKVAWVSGDEVMTAVTSAREDKRSSFENVCTGELLDDWSFQPIYAQAYLGGLGIAKALSEGADIVVCGRVSDASPVIGAAYWWHSWSRNDIDKLANSLVAGHLIECSNYVCGGNYTGFKALENKRWHDIGYPIAEIAVSGQVIITKSKGSGGEVSVDTCSSQLLYEIQGPWYYNSDVTAVLTNISFEQLSANRVAIHGIKGDLPPPTTKVGLTAKGGYQAEVHWFMTGLDIEEKARMMEAQARHMLSPHIHSFTKLAFTLNGSAAPDARSQNAATVDFRILAQAEEEKDLMPSRFFRPVVDPIMEGYPGATPHLDWRQALPKPIYEYWVTLMPQADIDHKVHLWDGRSLSIPPPSKTRTYSSQQPDNPTTDQDVVASMKGFGPTTRGPLGWVVHARSGDKGSNCNVGFWVRGEDEYVWLRNLLSTAKIKELLADEYKTGSKVDRCEFKNMRAVHFLLHDHLDRGVSCSSTYDFLGKNVAEFLRQRWVDLPVKFLDRGKL